MSSFEDRLHQKEQLHQRRFSQLGLVTDCSTSGDEGMKVTIIDKLDIRDDPRRTRVFLEANQQSHKFKGPKDRFKANCSNNFNQDSTRMTYFPVRKTHLIRNESPPKQSKLSSAASQKILIAEGQEQLQKKVNRAFSKMKELQDVYERRQLQKQSILMNGVLERSKSKRTLYKRFLISEN